MDNTTTGKEGDAASRAEMMEALFGQMVLQQANMALMLLGKVPHPQSGETVKDIEAARMFIDQLEMLEVKTKGNLNREEENLLRQSLMSLHLAFVEAVGTEAEQGKSPAAPESATPAASAGNPGPGSAEAPSDADSKKKFSKKY